MKKILFLLVGFAMISAGRAQLLTFETVTLDSGKVLNGSDGTTEFIFKNGANQNLTLPVHYDTGFKYWASGWAISRKIDSTTGASSASKHLYCAKPGRGVDSSSTFILGQNQSWFTHPFGPEKISSLYISNTTYAYNSMKFGDGFAKKFGGSSGNDMDYFLVRINRFYHGDYVDSSDIYLADYRSADNSKDYLVKDWIKVDFALKQADSFVFEVFSTDTSGGWINTPTFFAVDNIMVDPIEGVKQIGEVLVSLYPNPACDWLAISTETPIKSIAVYDVAGKSLMTMKPDTREFLLDISALDAGSYFVHVNTASGSTIKPLIISGR